MNNFSILTIFYIVIIIAGTCLILKQFNLILQQGKLILKINKSSHWDISWIIILIIWVLVAYLNASDYIKYNENRYIQNILGSIFWIELSIFYIIGSFRGVEIREKGIYNSGFFYKWPKIEGFNWVSQDTIEFKMHAYFKGDRSVKITIDEKIKNQIEEIIQRYLAL